MMDPHFFSTFLNTNLIVWLNIFFSQKFLNIIIVFQYCRIATMISLSKSIAKYGKFIFLKWNEVPYLQAQVLEKTWVPGAKAKFPRLLWTILVFFFPEEKQCVWDYRTRFSKQFEKRKYRKSYVRKTLVFPQFPDPNFEPIFSLRFGACDVSL